VSGEQRGEDAAVGVQAGLKVGHCDAHLARGAVDRACDVHEPAHRRRDHVIPATALVCNITAVAEGKGGDGEGGLSEGI